MVLPIPANPVLPILIGCCIVTVGAAVYPSPPSDISILEIVPAIEQQQWQPHLQGIHIHDLH